MNRLNILATALFVLTALGCSTQQYGQCPAPDEDLQIMFKPKITGHPFSHSFCIVCKPDLEESEYGAWALEMGTPQVPSTEGALPCLYVYSDEDGQKDSLEGCVSLVCDGNATYADMVSEKNGNFNLKPLLNGELTVLKGSEDFMRPMASDLTGFTRLEGQSQHRLP